MSLSSQVGLLATRVGTELKSIRNNYVPSALRGPIGGVTESASVSGTITIDPALTNQRRLIMTGDTTIAALAAGADGQRLLFEVNASGGQRIITFDTSVETSNAVTARTFTIPSGGWGYIALIYRANPGVWRLTSAEPQVVPDTTPPSLWLPADHGLVAWNYDPQFVTTTFGGATTITWQGAIKVASTALITQFTNVVVTAGSGMTSGRNAIGLYNAAGNLVAQSTDQSTNWASTGIKTASLVSAVTITPATYFAVIIVNATTSTPAFGAASNGWSTVGRAANSYRSAFTSPSSLTSLPSTRPTTSSFGGIVWVGLS